MTVGSKPSKNKVALVEFTYGNPVKKLRLAGSQYERDTSEGRFLPCPGISVKAPKNTISIARDTCQIRLPLGQENAEPFVSQVSSGRPHSIVSVRTMFLETEGTSSILWHTFFGKLLKTHRNPDGRPNIVSLEVANAKYFLDRSAGIPITPLCEWSFGDAHTCGFNPLTVEETGTVVTIVKSALVITLPSYRGHPYWEGGYVEFDGLRIKIKSRQGSTFVLAQYPPKTWTDALSVNQLIVKVVPGCDQKISTCHQVWHNIANFSGAGIAMPAYNPTFENPD